MPAAIPSIKLNSGHDMPQVGFGLWKVGNDICADVVYNAIKAGYRLLDGACDYGNEVECGQGVARAIKEGVVKREELFIVSKLWNTFHDGDRVEPAARRSLADWRLDYFDLYLVHFPVSQPFVDPAVRYPPGWHWDDAGTEFRRGKATTQETWRAMEALVSKGLARSIGVSNFQAQLLYDLLAYATVRPATLQIEHHPYLGQPDLLALCREEGIAVTAYSSFGPASFEGIDIYNLQHFRRVGPLLENPSIVAIAQRAGKTPAQVLLRWATRRGLAVIPKSSRQPTMLSNLDCVGWDLPKEDLDAITAMDQGFRLNAPHNYFKTQKFWIFG